MREQVSLSITFQLQMFMSFRCICPDYKNPNLNFLYRAAVFEEEDFQPSVYGYNLATNFSDSKALSMLRECEDDLQKSEKKLKSQKTSQNGEVAGAASSHDELEILNGLLARFKFLKGFYTLLLHIWKRDNLNECSKLISICQEALAVMQRTASVGIQRNTEDPGII